MTEGKAGHKLKPKRHDVRLSLYSEQERHDVRLSLYSEQERHDVRLSLYSERERHDIRLESLLGTRETRHKTGVFTRNKSDTT